MFIPNYNQALEIVRNNDAFLKKIVNVDGYDIHVFNYRLASYSDFEKPLRDEDYKAFELRGLSYINYRNMRYIMLHKFFNLGQTEGYHYSDVKYKKIIRIQDKLDGTMIRFIRLPNGRVIAKTKYDFGNDQTTFAESVYNSDKEFKYFIDYTLDNNLAAIFEYISPANRIVLRYRKSELQLLQLREEDTGKYLDVYKYEDRFGIKTVPYFTPLSNNLDYLMYLTKDLKDTEGWVVTFEDGQMMKIKTQWYLDNHKLLTEDIGKENWIISAILNENVDDAVSAIDKDDPARTKIEDITHKILHWMIKSIDEIEMKFMVFEGSRKDLAIANKSEFLFPVIMQCYSIIEQKNDLKYEDIENNIKIFIRKQTNTLGDAVKFLERISQ